MPTLHGWLLDLYDSQDGVALWFISHDGSRVCLHQKMESTFYAAGPDEQLRELWKFLRKRREITRLRRDERRDVFRSLPITVLAATVESNENLVSLFYEVQEKFPELTYYDVDLSSMVRHAAEHKTFPLSLCEVFYEGQQIHTIRVLDSRWNLDPIMPNLTTLTIRPDCDPARDDPQEIILEWDGQERIIPLSPPIRLIESLNSLMDQADPDLILTHWGDSWIFPELLKAEKTSGKKLHINRDTTRSMRWQKELTYYSYGHIVYRAPEAHLYGRCHIDVKHAMMWKDYALDGVLESARVTTLPIEKAARVSPGSGISTMQILTALEKGILVPWHKQQYENWKDHFDLIQRDRGGLVYQPMVGIFTDVAQIDFISMYPGIIILANISPETPLPDGINPATEKLGLIPLTLKPLYEKRIAIKLRAGQYETGSPLAAKDKARASALKWLLVVCFGYLGYANARFGRVEAHEAVTAGGRECLMRAKTIAEEAGCTVIQMYVDALWIQKPGATHKDDFLSILEEIAADTGLGISMDGVYKWIAFLPSRVDPRHPVANRYFGVLQDGSIVIRGLETRRHDTAPWIVEVQMKMIEKLSYAESLSELYKYYAPNAFQVFVEALDDLRNNKIELEDLVIATQISRDLDQYTSPTPAARAAWILYEKTGRLKQAGEYVRFFYIKNDPNADVIPWEASRGYTVDHIDQDKYITLLTRAASNVLQPFGISEKDLLSWARFSTVSPTLPLF